MVLVKKAVTEVYVGKAQRLPAEYQEVEYIQSTGSQYIATGIKFTNTMGMYAKLSSQDVSADSIYLGSNDNSSDSGSKKIGLGNSSSKLYFGFNDWLPASANRPATTANTIVELENNYLNSRLMKKNGTTIYTISQTLTENGYPINIFGHNGGRTAQYFSKIKLYSLKISDGNDIIADFVPCYRKSDSVIGMYDLVNDTFYTNAGTGTFTKGNDIPKYIKIRPETSTEEYVLLSDGGSTNRYSELTLTGTQCLDNATTYWNGNVRSTDAFGVHRKQFTKKIVGFEIVAYNTNNNYDSFWFGLSPDGTISSSGNIKYFKDGLWGLAESQTWMGNGTGQFALGYILNNTGTDIGRSNKSNATAQIQYRGTLENGVWNITVVCGSGEQFTGTYTPDSSIKDLYYIGFRSGRRYTGQASRFVSAKVTLEG